MSSSSKPPLDKIVTVFDRRAGDGERRVPAQDRRGTGLKASPQARFIPREALGEFSAWQPGAVVGAPGAPRVGAEPPAKPAAAAAAAEGAGPPPDVERRVAAARRAGYQDGYRDGLVALENFKQGLASQANAQLSQMLERFAGAFDGLDRRVAESVAHTAMQLARQIVRHELSVDPALVTRVATEALNAVLPNARHITVHVHPADLPLVGDGAAELLQARGARLIGDPALERGGVRVDSSLGSVDARIDRRWAELSSELGAGVPWSDGGEGDRAGAPA